MATGANATPGSRVAARTSRAQLTLVVTLLALAGVSWWWTVTQMRGMDDGPWTALGSTLWFLSVWTVMMAAMMFPSVAPTVALYARLANHRSWLPALLFPAGYLITWLAAGVLAVVTGAVAVMVFDGALAWDRAGQPLTAATLLAAAVYELTPWKNVCLNKCRSPLGALLGSWRDGCTGAVRMGIRNGAWCVGCCWALMASLFALGVMSLTRMAAVAAIIAAEKLLPWRRVGTYGTALVLLALGLLVLFAPDAIPGLTLPGQTMQPGDMMTG
jgi:predicted metal-binding membrane protein